jgi:hypothetical protein
MKIAIKNNRVLATTVISESAFPDCEFAEVSNDLKETIDSYIKPMWNGSEAFEGAIPEEIANQQAQEKETFVRAFMQKKAEDGQAYASEIRFRITKELIGKPIAEVNEIDAQCQNTVMPLLQLIEGIGADWWSAMNIALSTTEPTNAIALAYFNEVKVYIINYVQTNYPSEL